MRLFEILKNNGTGVLQGNFHCNETFLEINSTVGNALDEMLKIDEPSITVKFSLGAEYLGSIDVELKDINNTPGGSLAMTSFAEGIRFNIEPEKSEWYLCHLNFLVEETSHVGTFFIYPDES